MGVIKPDIKHARDIVKVPGKSKRTRLPFLETLALVKADVFRSTWKTKDAPKNEESFFLEALLDAKTTNCTLDFARFCSEVEPLSVNFLMVLNNKDKIVRQVVQHLVSDQDLSLPPVLKATIALARDLQQEFYPYFVDIANAIIHILDSNSTIRSLEKITAALECLAFITKYMQKYLLSNMESVFDTIYFPLLVNSRQKHITQFASESYAFLLRKLDQSDLERVLNHVYYTIFQDMDASEDYYQTYDKGVSYLLFELTKGVTGSLFSKAEYVYAHLLHLIIDNRIIKDFTVSEAQLNFIRMNMLGLNAKLLKHATVVNLSLIWNVVFDAFTNHYLPLLNQAMNNNPETLSIYTFTEFAGISILEIMHEWILYNNGAKIGPLVSIYSACRNILSVSNCPYILIKAAIKNVSLLFKLDKQESYLNEVNPLIAAAISHPSMKTINSTDSYTKENDLSVPQLGSAVKRLSIISLFSGQRIYAQSCLPILIDIVQENLIFVCKNGTTYNHQTPSESDNKECEAVLLYLTYELGISNLQNYPSEYTSPKNKKLNPRSIVLKKESTTREHCSLETAITRSIVSLSTNIEHLDSHLMADELSPNMAHLWAYLQLYTYLDIPYSEKVDVSLGIVHNLLFNYLMNFIAIKKQEETDCSATASSLYGKQLISLLGNALICLAENIRMAYTQEVPTESTRWFQSLDNIIPNLVAIIDHLRTTTTAIQGLADLFSAFRYISMLPNYNQEMGTYLKLFYLQQICPLVKSNLAHPSSHIRLSTIKLLSSFEQPDIIIYSNEDPAIVLKAFQFAKPSFANAFGAISKDTDCGVNNNREKSLRSKDGNVTKPTVNLFSILFEIESSEVTILNIKEKANLYARLALLNEKKRLVDYLVDIPLYYGISSLYNNFSLAIEQGKKLLTGEAKNDHDMFWTVLKPVFLEELGAYTKYQQSLEIIPEIKLNNNNWIQNDTNRLFKSSLIDPCPRIDHISTLKNILNLLSEFTPFIICENKNDIISILMSHYETEFVPLLGAEHQLVNCISNEQMISIIGDEVDNEIEISHKGLEEVVSQYTVSDISLNKLKSLVHTKMAMLLDCVTHIKDLTKVSQTADLKKVLYELLFKPLHQVQYLAIKCIMNYKNENITPYSDLLLLVSSGENGLETLTQLDLSDSSEIIKQEHKKQLYEILIPVLYSHLLTFHKKSKGGPTIASRRLAILSLCMDLNPQLELSLFMQVIFNIFDPIIVIRDTRNGVSQNSQSTMINDEHDVAMDSEIAAHLKRSVHPYKQIIYMALISDIIKILHLKVSWFVPQMLEVIYKATRLAHHIVSTEGHYSVKPEMVTSYSVVVKKGVSLFNKILAAYPDEFASIESIAQAFYINLLQPSLNQLKEENSIEPSPMMQFFYICATVSPMYSTFFTLNEPDSNSNNNNNRKTLPKILSCLNKESLMYYPNLNSQQSSAKYRQDTTPVYKIVLSILEAFLYFYSTDVTTESSSVSLACHSQMISETKRYVDSLGSEQPKLHSIIKSNSAVLNEKSMTQELKANIVDQLILPNVDLIVDQYYKCLYTSNHELVLRDTIVSDLPKNFKQRELNFFLKLVTYITNPESAQKLIDLLLPYLLKYTKLMVSEKIGLLKIITKCAAISMLHETNYLKLANIFKHEEDTEVRLEVANLLSQLAIYDESRYSSNVAMICRALNLTSSDAKLQVSFNDQEKDYNNIDTANISYLFEALIAIEKVYSVSLSIEELLPVVYNLLYFTQSIDYSTRNGATSALTSIITNRCGACNTATDQSLAIDLIIEKSILPFIKANFINIDQIIRSEAIKLFEVVINAVPSCSVSPFKPFLCQKIGNDTLLALFRHTKKDKIIAGFNYIPRAITATTKELISDDLLINFLFPIMTVYLNINSEKQRENDSIGSNIHNLNMKQVKNTKISAITKSAINSIGYLTSLISWSHYYYLLSYYMKKINSPNYSKGVVLNLIQRIISYFHYSINVPINSDLLIGGGMLLLAADSVQPQAKIASDDLDDESKIQMKNVNHLIVDNFGSLENSTSQQAIQHIVINQIIPFLYNNMVDTDMVSKLSTLKSDICLSIVHLLVLLPQEYVIMRLPNLLVRVCGFIKMKNDKAEKYLVNDTILQIFNLLGPSYLLFIIKALQNTLIDGYQESVLASIFSTLVENLYEKYFTKDLTMTMCDEFIDISMSIIEKGLFGSVTQKKENTMSVSHQSIVCKKHEKISITLSQLSKMVKTDQVTFIFLHMKKAMKTASSRKAKDVLITAFDSIANGLVHNNLIPAVDLMAIAYNLIQENVQIVQDTDKNAYLRRVPKQDQKFMVQEDTRTIKLKRKECYSENVYMFIDLGLTVLKSYFKKLPEFTNTIDKYNCAALNSSNADSVDMPTSSPITEQSVDVKLVAPFFSILGSSIIYAAKDESAAVAFWILASSFKWRHAEFMGLLPVIVEEAMDRIGRSTASTFKSPIVTNCFHFILQLLNELPEYELGLGNISLILSLLRAHFDDLQGNIMCFNFMAAIIKRRIVVPEIYDCIDEIGTLMIRTFHNNVYKMCSSMFVKFIFKYPLSQKKIVHYLEFVIRQCGYTQHVGRLHAIEILHTLISKLPAEVLDNFTNVLFISLSMVLVNDDETECRQASASAIVSLLSRAPQAQIDQVYTIILTWAESENSTLRRTFFQLVSLLNDDKHNIINNTNIDHNSNSLSKKLAKHLNSSITLTVACIIAESHLHNINKESKIPMNYSEDVLENKDGNGTWIVLYYATLAFSKLFGNAKKRSLSLSSNELWAAIHQNMLYPHNWVRTVSSYTMIDYISQYSLLPHSQLENLIQPKLATKSQAPVCQGMHESRSSVDYIFEKDNAFLIACSFIDQLSSVGLSAEQGTNVSKGLYYLTPILRILNKHYNSSLSSTFSDKNKLYFNIPTITECDNSNAPQNSYLGCIIENTASLSLGHLSAGEKHTMPSTIIRRKAALEYFSSLTTVFDSPKELIPYLSHILIFTQSIIKSKENSFYKLKELANELLSLLTGYVGVYDMVSPLAIADKYIDDRNIKLHKLQLKRLENNPKLAENNVYKERNMERPSKRTKHNNISNRN